jgi:heat-inducible transcriptional repressor
MLSIRQVQILHAIIDNYIRSAEPVGSRTISKREDIGFSSATIRNEMADLEELGFLEQPHTSAGRIPSEKGYRFYVDHLLKPVIVEGQYLHGVRRQFADKYYQFEQLIQNTAAILSSLTNYTSIVLGQEAIETRLKQIQLVPLSDQSAVAVIVMSTGEVEHKKVEIPQGLSVYEIEKLVQYLNTKLSGLPLLEVRMKIQSEMTFELQKLMDNYESVLQIIETTFERKPEDMLIMKGTTNIMMQPEFRDVDKVKDVLEFLDKNELVMKHFSPSTPGIQVKIGTENRENAINNCTIITATYHLNGKPLGTIGILGPTRMEYGKVIGVLDYLSADLSKMMEKLHQGK